MQNEIAAQDGVDLRQLCRRSGVDADRLSELGDAVKAHRRSFRPGTIVKLEGDDSDAIYCVLSGWLSISKSLEDGQRQVVDFVLPGEIANPSSADGYTSSVQVEAMTPVTAAVLPIQLWNRLCHDYPEVRAFEMQGTAASMSRLSERMLRLGRGTAEIRIAYALIELCMRLAAVEGNGCGQFHLPLTQQQLGDFTGLSSVHVCRTLRRLSRKEIIATADHMDIRIHDMPALSEIAGIDPETLRSEIIPGAE